MQPSCCPWICKPFSTLVKNQDTASGSKLPGSTWGKGTVSTEAGYDTRLPSYSSSAFSREKVPSGEAATFLTLTTFSFLSQFCQNVPVPSSCMYLFEQRPAKLSCGSLAGQGVFPGEGCIGSDHQSSANILRRSKRSKPVKRCFPPVGFIPRGSQEANQSLHILRAAAAPAGGAGKHLTCTTRCSCCVLLFHLRPGAHDGEAKPGSAEGAECPLPHPQNC